MAKNITIAGVRFGYVRVFEPTINADTGKEEYSICVLIPKTNTKALTTIKKAIEEVLSDPASLSKWGMSRLVKGQINMPLKDGDVDKDTASHPEYAGMMYFNARSKTQPGVAGTDRQPILNKDEFYSGCWGAFNGSVFPYNAEGKKKGISIGLSNVMKMRDGKALTGRQSIDEAFANVNADDYADYGNDDPGTFL